MKRNTGERKRTAYQSLPFMPDSAIGTRRLNGWKKDFQNWDGILPGIKVSIPFESLSGDARFKDLLKRMGLPE